MDEKREKEIKLETMWRAASPYYTVCPIGKVTKNQILAAVMDGANTFEDLRARLPLCEHDECAGVSPTGRGCRENAEMLLKIYLPTRRLMEQDGGCKHESKPRILLNDEGKVIHVNSKGEEIMEITKQTTMGEMLKYNMGIAKVLMLSGMHCVGCPSSINESLEEACMVHGLNADQVLASIQDYLRDNPAE